MAGFNKPKVYTGVNAALSVADSATGTLKRVAYLTGFSIDLSANSEDFNVLGQRYQESIPTYNSWTASSDGKASFENEGQRALMDAYNRQDFIYCEFIINNGEDYYGTADASAVVKANGYASIESLTIDAGDGVTGISISLKGTGGLGFKYPTIHSITSISLSQSTLSLGIGDTAQLFATISPDNASNKEVSWTTSSSSVAKVDQDGFVYAVANGTATITATATGDTTKTDTCSVTVGTGSSSQTQTPIE